ncbi:MAG TPA: RNA 2',3'-cyclic phosphodiesterase [Acidobacteriota bacterium]|nr:RNA 2',3'-cyclic phosphodiesterase [Acidobacteriota bacterium]
MMRLFIALPLTRPVEEQLGRIISLCRQTGGPVKWVVPHNVHVTARFLGDTEQARVPSLKTVIDEVSAQFRTIASAIDRLGGFPNLNRPRVIWAGLGENTETMANLARQIELRVRKLRFEPEKKSFRAHLTLGRVRSSRGIEELTAFLQSYKFEAIPIQLDRICLFKSTLTPTGPIYERLHEALLQP